MRDAHLSDMSVDQLVGRIAKLAAEQDIRLLDNNVAAANRLYDQMQAIAMELKSREGDQRKALLVLYDHPNMRVRLVAATKTLAIAPQAARKKLEEIKASGWLPDSGEAGMSLRGLDDGTFKPT
jgi:hypothetical protein